LRSASRHRSRASWPGTVGGGVVGIGRHGGGRHDDDQHGAESHHLAAISMVLVDCFIACYFIGKEHTRTHREIILEARFVASCHHGGLALGYGGTAGTKHLNI
jgi:hypothetical protein